MNSRKTERRDGQLLRPSGELSATEKELAAWVKCRRRSALRKVSQ